MTSTNNLCFNKCGFVGLSCLHLGSNIVGFYGLQVSLYILDFLTFSLGWLLNNFLWSFKYVPSLLLFIFGSMASLTLRYMGSTPPIFIMTGLVDFKEYESLRVSTSIKVASSFKTYSIMASCSFSSSLEKEVVDILVPS